ncbi:MAG: hypothetical protein WEE36_00365 [Acidimicrobiia bacterium]
MDIFDLDSLLAQLILGLGAALVIGNGFALVQAKRGVKPKGAEGDLRRGRAWFLLAVGLVIAIWGATSLLAGSSDPEPATTTSTTAGALATTTSAPSTTTIVALKYEVTGVLPDGRAYIVTGLDKAEVVQGIQVAIQIFAGPEQLVLGITTLDRSRLDSEVPIWEGDTLRVPAGDWTVSIATYDHVLERAEVDDRDTIAAAIHGYSVNGMPALALEFPLSFPADEEIPFQMEVQYETFTVRRRCDPDLARSCSSNGMIQVLALSDTVAPAPPEPPDTIGVEAMHTGDTVRFLVLGMNPDGPGFYGRVDHARDQASLEELWTLYAIPGEPPVVDLDSHLVLFYAIPDDACPDDLLYMHMQDELIAEFRQPFGACLQPLIPTSYAVSIDRSSVPGLVIPTWNPEG